MCAVPTGTMRLKEGGLIEVVALPSAFTICIQAMNLFMNLVKEEFETRKLSSRSELRRFGGHLTIGREGMVEDCS